MPRPRRRPSGDYGNRSDLQSAPSQPVRTPGGRPYGERQASEQAQAAVPLPDKNAQLAQALQAAKDFNFQPVGLGEPTSRPDEPLTAGLPIGEGPGPQPFIAPQGDDVEMELRALYARFPNDDLRSLIEDIDEGRTF